MTRLLDLVDQYELCKEITSEYAYQLRYGVKRLNKYLHRESTIRDLSEQTINQWLKHERDTAELSDRSRANVRTSVLTIWSQQKKKPNRENIRSVVVSPKNPEAWYFDELKQVADAARELPGRLSNGVPRSLYFETMLWFAYETGLRRRDVWSFDLHRLTKEFVASLTQHKTRRVHVVQITRETAAAMRKIERVLATQNDRTPHLPLRWSQSISQFYYWMKRCRVAAGVDPDIRNRAIQHVRRTGCTEVATEGGPGWRYLGHTREGLDRKHYTDQSKAVRPIIPERNRSDGRSPSRATTVH